MRGPIRQAAHIAYEVAFFLATIPSRVLNASRYNGSMHQTTSARAHTEARRGDPEWIERERRIDRFFCVLTRRLPERWRQKDHCAIAWQAEVSRALKTLQRNGDL